ncbi:MAG: phosphate acetyltransferase, partial [Candidatus Eisenbacteria bacterium]|nr:phosphate acetyltransferase [Candidatus Eisenbacteria bacterium]
MTAILDRLRQRVRLAPRRLVLCEVDDPRVVRAADRLARERLADVTLLGSREAARRTARSADLPLTGVALADSAEASEIERTSRALQEVRGDRLGSAALDSLARDPLFQAAARVRAGLADCFVAGASRTSADVLRSALWLIGLSHGFTRVSSFFLMVFPARGGAGERAMVFADCGVVPDPDAPQLAEIGILAADHFARLTGEVPHTAFLSFS